MNKMTWVIALSIAVPAVASAQTAPAPAPKMACCEKMKEKCDCCEDMAKMDQSKHDMKGGMDANAGQGVSQPAPPASHSNH